MRKPYKAVPFTERSNNLYAELGIASNASSEAIESAYRVLERVYCPDGAYSDDVMRQAFLDISNAASILRDPEKRWQYECGYIDESGRPTREGNDRAQRRKRLQVSRALLCFAALFLIAFWVVNPGHNSAGREALAPASTSTGNGEQASAKALLPPKEKTILFPGQPAMDAAASATAGTRVQETSSPQVLPSIAQSEAASPAPPATPGHSAEANPADYLPPKTIFQPNPGREKRQRGAQISRKNIPPAQSKPGRHAGEMEERRTASLPPRGTTETTLSRRPGIRELRFPVSAARSAQCLACITNDEANCSKLCP
jgi:curved DNA-binding protein CbpA